MEPASGRVKHWRCLDHRTEPLAVRRCIAYVGAAPCNIFRHDHGESYVIRPEKREPARKMSQLLGLEATINL
jgi:hypothetical protein